MINHPEKQIKKTYLDFINIFQNVKKLRIVEKSPYSDKLNVLISLDFEILSFFFLSKCPVKILQLIMDVNLRFRYDTPPLAMGRLRDTTRGVDGHTWPDTRGHSTARPTGGWPLVVLMCEYLNSNNGKCCLNFYNRQYNYNVM